jgi:hypothetical protein
MDAIRVIQPQQEQQAPALGPTYESQLGNGMVLRICPGKEVSWDAFRRESPPYSVALDGIVRGVPRFDAEGTRANFNHHQDVDRLATRSTSGQVLVALKQGLMDAFQVSGAPKMNIYVNDPDQDSSCAVWLLANHERIIGTKSEPLMSRLISAEDLLDTTAGAYPFDPNSKLMRELAWIFDPYVQARMGGRVRAMEGAEMANVIDAVGLRISKYTLGDAQQLSLDTRVEELGGGETWRMIREVGFYARTGLFARGIKAFVSLLGEAEGAYHYSIGKMSPYIAFPIQEIYVALNHLEGLDMASGTAWNGGDTIGGSPRRVGSKLSPAELESAINRFLSRGVREPAAKGL